MKPRMLALGLLLATLLSLGWWIRQLTTPDEVAKHPTLESPNAIADNLRVDTYDAAGRLEQTLTTPHMEHFESSDTSELERPVLWRFTPEAPPWRMQAEKALAYDREERVFLPGEVIIDRDADAENPPYHIVTRDLTLETADAHATTEAPVRMESEQQWITAVGMEAWLREPIKLNLLNRVRGHYVFD